MEGDSLRKALLEGKVKLVKDEPLRHQPIPVRDIHASHLWTPVLRLRGCDSNDVLSSTHLLAPSDCTNIPSNLSTVVSATNPSVGDSTNVLPQPLLVPVTSPPGTCMQTPDIGLSGQIQRTTSSTIEALVSANFETGEMRVLHGKLPTVVTHIEVKQHCAPGTTKTCAATGEREIWSNDGVWLPVETTNQEKEQWTTMWNAPKQDEEQFFQPISMEEAEGTPLFDVFMEATAEQRYQQQELAKLLPPTPFQFH
eukprot:TRINITY_DN67608_c0_g2_i1.p1 TRINITY_DN67608_c0_g2~~TRINITY_DN67608_c0_g2_i1.p1  ORF type:complete len:253 (-),score=18.24 TRINITY_DN67608_c0_g2_i1:97-855(-)